MSALLGIVSALLLLFEVVLVARVLLDWAGVLAAPSARATTPIGTARTVVHRVTEPVLAPVRRILPPLHLGRVRLDLSIVAVLLVVLVLRTVLA